MFFNYYGNFKTYISIYAKNNNIPPLYSSFGFNIYQHMANLISFLSPQIYFLLYCFEANL